MVHLEEKEKRYDFLKQRVRTTNERIFEYQKLRSPQEFASKQTLCGGLRFQHSKIPLKTNT